MVNKAKIRERKALYYFNFKEQEKKKRKNNDGRELELR